MTHDELIREKAWEMYCEETKDSPAAADFPNQVPRVYWENLLIRAATSVIAPARAALVAEIVAWLREAAPQAQAPLFAELIEAKWGE